MVRKIRERVLNDFYPTKQELFKVLIDRVEYIKPYHHIIEPCCGNGDLTKQFSKYGYDNFTATDYYDNVMGGYWLFNDATKTSYWENMEIRPDWLITNPPYNQACLPILENGLKYCHKGIAFLQRLSFLEPTRLREQFLKENKFTDIIIIGQPRPKFNNDTVTTAWFVVNKFSDTIEITFATKWLNNEDQNNDR